MAQMRVRYAMARRQDVEPIFSPDVAAGLAGISRQALDHYRRAGLVQPQTRAGVAVGYRAVDIQRLACIRRLRKDMDLDLGAIEVVLHLRQQIVQLQRETDSLRQQATQREGALLKTIHRLRRQLAIDGEFSAG